MISATTVLYAVACGFSIAFGVNVAANDLVGGIGTFIGAAFFFVLATIRKGGGRQ